MSDRDEGLGQIGREYQEVEWGSVGLEEQLPRSKEKRTRRRIRRTRGGRQEGECEYGNLRRVELRGSEY